MTNDFSSDPNCVALFRFDNNPNDSKGNNDLTPVNSPTYNSGDRKEGTHSLELERDNSQYLYRADADLDTGFPGKSGASEQSFSICLWLKPESFTAAASWFISKWNSVGANKRTFGIVALSSGVLYFYIGYNSGSNSTGIAFGTALDVGKWYHIAVTYDSSDNGMKLRIWDDNAGALLDSNKEGTAGGDMSPTDVAFEVGRGQQSDSYCFDGKIDEVVIFKDMLTDAEIDQIRAGTYGAATEKESSDTGTGIDAIESLETPQAKTSSDAGSGLEASNVEGEGQPENLFAGEPGEGADRLVAKIETPAKGGGLKL